MKKLFYTLLLGVLPLLGIKGQYQVMQFGKISQQEIDLKNYSKDPTAEAVVLCDIGDVRFADAQDYSYNVEFTRTRRIKIFTNAGISYGEVSIPLYNDNQGNNETLEKVEAFCYNWENNQLNRTELDMSNVYEEKINNRLTFKKFVVPGTKPGSIIEYRYVILSPFHFSLPTWRFQDHIPTVYSMYVTRMIPFYEYTLIMQGSRRFDSQTNIVDPEQRLWGNLSDGGRGTLIGTGMKFNDFIHTYIMKDIPAFRDEAFISSDEDYLIKLDFQESKFHSYTGTETAIISTWPKLIQDLLKDDVFGKFMRSFEKPAKKLLASEIDTAGKSPITKCKNIVDFVKKSYKWDEIESIYSTRSQKEFINQKTGNCAEINLFLTQLLRTAGINASPVILSTRDHGKIKADYPFLHFFNYVLVLVTLKDQTFLCDGCEFYTDFNRIPPRCINDKGLVVKDGDLTWVPLNLDYKSIDHKEVGIEINPAELKIKARLELNAAEMDAYWYRKTFQNDSLKLRKKIADMGFQEISNVSTSNFERHDLPYTISAVGESEIEQLDNKLVISPYLSFYPKENQLKQPTRTYPIDFTFADMEEYKCNILIPDGYKVLSVPENFSLDNSSVLIKTSYTVNGKTIMIESAFGFKKAFYPSTEYLNIKSYFDTIIKKFNDQIVLIKS